MALGGCAAPSAEQSAAGAAARAFVDGLANNPEAACDLLAPRTRESLEDNEESSCAEALPEVGVPTTVSQLTVEVAGHSAQVRTGTDVLFLARFDGGWRITAAGCTQRSSDRAVPYACLVKE